MVSSGSKRKKRSRARTLAYGWRKPEGNSEGAVGAAALEAGAVGAVDGGAAEESSRTRAARASGLAPRSQSAMSSERVWRSRPVSRIWDIWNASSSDSFACLAEAPADSSIPISGAIPGPLQ